MNESRYLPPGARTAPKAPGFPWLTVLLALLYGASPIDFIPDLIPLLGLADDAGVALVGLFIVGRWVFMRHKALKGTGVK